MTNEIEQDENRLIAQRREKLAEIREQGNAFPNDFRRDVVNAELLTEYENTSAEQLKESPRRVKIAGRLMTKRVMGKASFANIRDMSGDMQLYVKRDNLAEGVYA
ncbi:MAG: lysine--tRNA ligase, partial [Proteobacteria bacterium]|nr:lysine--tRNA ligase [Pseudomonadota bacterium]